VGRLTLLTVLLLAGSLTTLRQAQPFWPVPDEVEKQTLAIDCTFHYRIEKK
jgi:hypothetical protein